MMARYFLYQLIIDSNELSRARMHCLNMSGVSETILIAEDELLIRMDAVEELELAGFIVLEAGDADEALAILAAIAEKIHGLFTDVHMPGTRDGLELAHHVKKHWPQIALLIASAKARPAPHALPHGCRFLEKPYDPRHAVQHLRDDPASLRAGS